MKRCNQKLIVAAQRHGARHAAAARLAAGWADDSASQIPTTGEKVDGAPVRRSSATGAPSSSPTASPPRSRPASRSTMSSPTRPRASRCSRRSTRRLRHRLQDGQGDLPDGTAPRSRRCRPTPTSRSRQIEAKLAAGEIDCISIEPVSSDSTTAITNKLMDQGIPVFTVGVTSRGHEFTNFTQMPAQGRRRRRPRSCSNWMKANNKRPQGLRRLRRRPDPVLGAGPHEGLPRGDHDGDPGRQVRDHGGERPQHQLRPGPDL